MKFLRSSIPSSIEIRQNISVYTDVISGDPTQIHQVMINLCTNAAHAMEEEGGIMEISLTNLQNQCCPVKFLESDETYYNNNVYRGYYFLG